jgi:pimeloyl-ACP methyl ester carboxylesterase
MSNTNSALPERIRRTMGALPAAGSLPQSYPFETMVPQQQGFVETSGVRVWYGVFGASGPWLCFAPLNQIATASAHKGVVPYLSTMFRTLVMDLPGTGLSDQPMSSQAYGLDQYLAHFCAVLDHLGIEQTTLVATSINTLLAIRFATEQPSRVSRLIIAGGFADTSIPNEPAQQAAQKSLEQMRSDWPNHLDKFWSSLFTEPHSTKAYEDGVGYSCA